MLDRRECLTNDLASTPSTGRDAPFTIGRVTVNAKTRNTLATLGVLGALALAACGGGHGDTYAKGTQVQEQCCEHLSGDGRSTCLQHVVKVDDPAVQKSKANQSTYACVVDHFSCDASTGHATTASAQAQLECIQDLH